MSRFFFYPWCLLLVSSTPHARPLFLPSLLSFCPVHRATRLSALREPEPPLDYDSDDDDEGGKKSSAARAGTARDAGEEGEEEVEGGAASGGEEEQPRRHKSPRRLVLNNVQRLYDKYSQVRRLLWDLVRLLDKNP